MPKIEVQSRSLLKTIHLKLGLLKLKVYLERLRTYRLSMPRGRRDLKERVRRVRRKFEVLRSWRLEDTNRLGVDESQVRRRNEKY